MSVGLEQQIRIVADAAFEQTSAVRGVAPRAAGRTPGGSLSPRGWLMVAAAVLVVVLVGAIALVAGSEEPPVVPIDPAPSTTTRVEGTIESTAVDLSGEFSARGVLSVVPLPGDEQATGLRIGGADFTAIAQLAGVERDGRVDGSSPSDWFDLVFREESVGLPESMLFIAALRDADGFEDEFGFSVLDVDRYVAVTNYLGASFDQLLFPFDVMVLGGDMTALTERAGDDSIIDIGEGADDQTNVADRTEFRPVGRPLRVGVDESRSMVAVSKSTPFVAAWLDTDGASLADVSDLAAAAAVLDRDDELYAAEFDIQNRDVSDLEPEITDERSASDFPIIEEFTTMAMGFSGVDESQRTTIVYVFADERAASASVDPIERLYAPDTEVRHTDVEGVETVGDVFLLDDVTVIGRSVAVVGHTGDGGPNEVRRVLFENLGPFIGHR